MAEEETQSPAVPSPPSEVVIRTLESDLKSMALSGGGVPVPQTVVFAPQALKPKSGRNWFIWISILIALLGFGAVGYFFLYPVLFPTKSSGHAPLVTPGRNEPPRSGAIVPDFEHASFFRVRSDEALALTASEAAESVSDLQTFNQKLSALLDGARPDSSFIEVVFKRKDGRPLDASAFLSFTKLNFFDRDFVVSHLRPDFTFFVFRDPAGFSPGFVLRLKPGEDFFPIRSEVKKIEKSLDLENLFLRVPGARSGVFKDGLLKTQPFRYLDFRESGARFVYAMVRDYLVISASSGGFEEVVRRL